MLKIWSRERFGGAASWRTLQCEVRPELVVLLMLNSVAAFSAPHRLHPLLTTVGSVTSGLALYTAQHSIPDLLRNPNPGNNESTTCFKSNDIFPGSNCSFEETHRTGKEITPPVLHSKPYLAIQGTKVLIVPVNILDM